MIVGKEWIIDASGCRADDLRDVNRLRAVFARVIDELGLQVVGEQLWRQFPAPGGITGLALLSESHLTCHTYPEFSSATFNLYCCRARPDWPWSERLQEMLSARDVSIRVVERNVTQDETLLTDSRVTSES